MEKLTYGKYSNIDLIFQQLKNQIVCSIKGRGKLIRKPSFRFRTYSGVAGIIRRRMVISISVALFSGSFSILTGFFLYASGMVNLAEAITVVGLLFTIGLLLNGWLILRMMSSPLKNIEYVEDSLVKMVETGMYKIDDKSPDLELNKAPFVRAYYSLLEHVDTIETHNLEFLAKISHEIRSPLASILGYSELLTDAQLRHDDQFIDNCYQIIRKEGNQVCRLVEDAVLAAGIGSGHYNFEFAPIKVAPLITHIVDEARKKTRREIHFYNEASEVTIVADPVSLREAINNLIDNSVKFSRSDTPIEVRIKEAKNPYWIEIYVIDQGIGIEEEDTSILFRRFSRIRNAETNDIPGNGLGLYIANNIILNHQGEILVESQPNIGSTFKVVLPVEMAIE
ncbi:MAG: sensor histidine kinase [Anaerolineales bacterium]